MFNLFVAVLVAAMIIVGLIIVTVVLFTSLMFIVVAGGLAWIMWHLLARSRPARPSRTLGSKSAVERLTDKYVSGRIDIHEFEQKVASVLHHQAP